MSSGGASELTTSSPRHPAPNALAMPPQPSHAPSGNVASSPSASTSTQVGVGQLPGRLLLAADAQGMRSRAHATGIAALRVPFGHGAAPAPDAQAGPP